jgi:hypothetical protein
VEIGSTTEIRLPILRDVNGLVFLSIERSSGWFIVPFSDILRVIYQFEC